MARSFLQHAPNVGSERHMREQQPLKNLLAIIHAGFCELFARFGEMDVATFDIGEAQHLQGLDDGEQVVDSMCNELAMTGRSAVPP